PALWLRPPPPAGVLQRSTVGALGPLFVGPRGVHAHRRSDAGGSTRRMRLVTRAFSWRRLKPLPPKCRRGGLLAVAASFALLYVVPLYAPPLPIDAGATVDGELLARLFPG